MESEDTYLTREGYEKLQSELDYLTTVRRKELSKAIAQARSFGDISENAEYEAAKEAQGLNEKRAAELENKLSRVRIIDDENISSDEVRIGATVVLNDLDSGEEIKYTLVAEVEADPINDKISISSPVGKQLLGCKADDSVEIKVPAGSLRYKIITITR